MRTYGLFYLAGLCTVAQLATAVFIEVPAGPVAAALAVLLGISAAIFIYWSLFALYRHGRIPQNAGYPLTTAVVDRGPYAVIRHPQYLGYILINLTFMLSNPFWPGMLLGCVAVFGYYAYALQEDRRLCDAFGPDYDAYMEQVPGFNVPLGLLRFMRG